MVHKRNSMTCCCAVYVFSAMIMASISLAAGDRKLNDDTGNAGQLNPASAMSRYGAAVFVWEDNRTGSVNIYGQRLTMKGPPAGANFRVTPAGWSVYQMNPDAAMDDRGRFVVVWDEKGRSGQDVYGKLFAANGAPIREAFEIAKAADISETMSSACVAMDSAGNFTVCWNKQKANQSDIFIRRYDAAGAELGPAKRINAQLTGYSKNPAIGMNRRGNFVVAWEDNLTGVTDILAQRFDSSGAIIGGNFEASNLPGQTHPAREPAVDLSGDFEEWSDHFCIVFSCQGPGDLADDIHAYTYYGDGRSKTATVSDSTLAAEDRYPDVTSFGFSLYRVIWQSNQDSDIHARVIGGSGPIAYYQALRINETTGTQNRPCISYGHYSTLYAWADNRNGNSDIYASWDVPHCPSFVNAGSGFKGMVPLSWDPIYMDDATVSYKIYRFGTTRDSLDMMEQSGWFPTFDDFDYVATVDPGTRVYPKLMLDWIDRDVVEGKIYRYTVEAQVEDDGTRRYNTSWHTAAPSAGYAIASKWTDTPPVLDGNLSIGEWMGAAQVSIRNLDAPKPVMLYVMNDENALYIAAGDQNDVIVDPLNMLSFLIDRDNNDSWDAASPSDEGAYQVASTAAAFTGYYGSYPDGFRMMPLALSPADLQGAVSASSGHLQYEARLDLPAAPGSAIGFAASVSDPGALYRIDFNIAGMWPPGALWEAAETLGELTLAVNTGVTDRNPYTPHEFHLYQNTPNPFNPSTTIRFSVAEPCRVELRVFDVRGREVSVLANGAFSKGEHVVRFDASGLPGGVYFYRIQMGEYQAVEKMVLMR
jgi:hypothetical protein